MGEQERTVVEYYGASTDGRGGGLVQVTLDPRQEQILAAWRERLSDILNGDMGAVVASMERAGLARRAAENAAIDAVADALESELGIDIER
jgi:hypothetical protein